MSDSLPNPTNTPEPVYVPGKPGVMYCANHPTVETTLRCNRCNKPICAKCAVLTPTGYRCKECVRGQQKIFVTAHTYDYPLAFVVAAILAYIGSFSAMLGFFVIFLAPIAGGIIGEAIRRITGRRRAKLLFQLAAAGAILGALLPILFRGGLALLVALMGGGAGYGFGGLLGLIWYGVYLILMVPSMYYRLSGISI